MVSRETFVVAASSNAVAEVKKVQDPNLGLVQIEVKADGSDTAFIANQLIIQLKPGIVASGFVSKYSAKGLYIKESLPKNRILANFNNLNYNDLQAFIAQLKANSAEVVSVETNLIALSVDMGTPGQAQINADDQYFQFQWGMPKIGAPSAWDVIRTAPDVTVAVVDSGVMTAHVDLQANFSGKQYDTVSNDGVAEDGTGHGTHVAGILGAVGNNKKGVTGVAWTVPIMPVRVLANNGSGTTVSVSKGLDWAVDNGAKVVNMSLAYPTPQPPSMLTDSMQKAFNQNVLIVCAADNRAKDLNIYANKTWPACYSDLFNNVISVAATDSNDQLATFSNWGTGNVSVAAPGVDIYSTSNLGSYIYNSGTSMASPMVAGIAALTYQRFGTSQTPDQVHTRIKNSVEQVPSLAGKVSTGGRVNLARTLSVFSNVPSAANSTWRNVPLFGWQEDKSFPWVYSYSIGWYYTKATSVADMWFYNNTTGHWCWTSNAHYPTVWDDATKTWYTL